MTRHNSNKAAEKVRRKITLTSAAGALGVTREHLSRVLHGHRQSRRLTRRYQEYLREQDNNQTEVKQP